jgi:hypothetical protein
MRQHCLIHLLLLVISASLIFIIITTNLLIPMIVAVFNLVYLLLSIFRHLFLQIINVLLKFECSGCL